MHLDAHSCPYTLLLPFLEGGLQMCCLLVPVPVYSRRILEHMRLENGIHNVTGDF